MKLLLVLLAVLFTFTVIIEADATHLPRFSGGQYDDIFYWQEIDVGNSPDQVGRCEVKEYQLGLHFRVSSTGSVQGVCGFFKSFDVEDIDGKDVINDFNWERTSGTDTTPSYRIYDGSYIGGNSTDFPVDGGITLKGAGLLYDSGTLGGGCGLPDCSPDIINADLSAGNQTQATIMFAYMRDSDGITGNTGFQTQHSFSIEDLGTFTFCGKWTVCETQLRPISTEGSGNNEFGSMYSTDNIWLDWINDWGVITDFTATTLNDTAVRFDWTSPTGIQDANHGIPITGFLIEYLNGANDEEIRYHYITTTGDVETYTADIFLPDHSYTARLLTEGGNEQMSNPSNTDTWTQTDGKYNSQFLVYDQSKDIGSEVGSVNCRGLDVANSGTKLYVSCWSPNHVLEYTMSTPYDLDSLLFIQSKAISGFTNLWSVDLSPDGTRALICETSDADCFSYTLSTAWDIDSATSDGKSISGVQSGALGDAQWGKSGERIYLSVGADDRIEEWTMTIPYDLDTATLTNSKDISTEMGLDVIKGIHVSADGVNIIVYHADGTNEEHSQWTMSTPYDVTTFGTQNRLTLTGTGSDNSPHGGDYSDDGLQFFFFGDIANDMIKWTIDNTQTFTAPDLREGIDQRIYYREGNIFTTDSLRAFANCNDQSWSGDQRRVSPIPDSDFGVCWTFIKAYPWTVVNGTDWRIDGAWGRDVADVQYQTEIWDGNYEPWESERWIVGESVYYQTSTVLDDGPTPIGAGLLYQCRSNDLCNQPDESIWNPNLSSATESHVTIWTYINDSDLVAPAEVSSALEYYEIVGKFKLWVPPSSLQGQFPATTYFSGTEHDWGWIDGIWEAESPVLTGEINSIDTNTSDLSWTETGAYSPVDTYDVYKQCDDDVSFTLLDTITPPEDETYHDEFFSQEDVFDPCVGDPPLVADYETNFGAGNFTGWVSSDTSAPYYFRFNNDELQFHVRELAQNLVVYKDIGLIDDELWKLQGYIRFDELDQISFNWFMFGIGDETNTNIWSDSQDFLGWRVVVSGSGISTTIFERTQEGGTTTANILWDTTETGNDAVIDKDYWWELVRTSATSVTVNVYTDPSYNSDFLIGTGEKTNVLATTDNLRYIKGSNANTAQADSPISGEIDDLMFFDGVGGFRCAVPRDFCDYYVEVFPSIGVGQPVSNTFRIGGESEEGGGGETCTNISSNQLDFNWIADQFGEDLQGYNVQISTDDVTFINSIENTFSTSTTHKITGLEDATLYYIQWRNMFFDGTTGDYSTSIQCTTLQGGGGGTPTPDPVCTLQQLLDPDHECFEPVDECTPISSFEIIGGRENNVNIGQTSHNNLSALWSGNDNLRIDEIVPDDTTGIKLAFQQPIEFPPGIAGIATSDIPYTIQNPPTECVDEQTPNCIYQNAEYEIPVKIFGSSCQEEFRVDSTIIVTIRDDQPFDFRLLLLAIIGMFLIFFIIAKRKKKKKFPKKQKPIGGSTKRSNQIKNKKIKRPNFG